MNTKNLETIIYTKNNNIAEIRFNRPHRLNAVVEQLYKDVLTCIESAEQDTNIRVILIRGEGRAFCVGADMKEHDSGERSINQKRAYLSLANDVCQRIFECQKPIIAAVNGYALGAGAEMAVAADFLLMAESAQIGFPEISIGTFLGGGVSYILPSLVGLAQARRLIFSGERINGPQAKNIGLAVDVFADEEFIAGVYAFTNLIGSKAPVSMNLAKQQLNTSASTGFHGCLARELEGIVTCMQTTDWQEGVDAFAEKREPIFKGE
jgi:enoyl-CoA hydratase